VRIKLKDGKQRELIYSTKIQNDYTWQEFAEYLNVSFPALKEWYLENCLLPTEIFEILNKQHNYDEFIMDVKDERWGQILGGKISKGSTRDICRPEKNEELSELVGIILGDGNISVYIKGTKVATYSLRICGHIDKEQDYLTNFVSSLIEKLFDIKSKFYISNHSNAFYLIVNSRKLTEFLYMLGLKNGNKVKNQVEIPKWIKENLDFSRSCIRGLIDTDGSIHRMSKRDSNLMRISFKSHNVKMLLDVREMFLTLGFHPSKIINGNSIYLSRKKDVEKYINEIGFHNLKHKKRLETFSPVV
jgi:intein/homing endonuclease